jgi:hypothetical protein
MVFQAFACGTSITLKAAAASIDLNMAVPLWASLGVSVRRRIIGERRAKR